MLTIPLGPAAFLSMKSALSSGFKSGFRVACGSITSDFLWLSAVITIPIFQKVISDNMSLIYFLGGFLVCIVGFIIFRINEEDLKRPATYTRAFAVSITNLTFTITATLFLVRFANGYQDYSMNQKAYLVIGIVLGELVWWTIGLRILIIFKQRISIAALPKVYGSAIFIGGVIWVIRSLTR
jgi:threonine/homoserine/homoserine lactone efflux protein